MHRVEILLLRGNLYAKLTKLKESYDLCDASWILKKWHRVAILLLRVNLWRNLLNLKNLTTYLMHQEYEKSGTRDPGL